MCEKLWISLLLVGEMRRRRKSNFSIFVHWFPAVNHVFPHKLFRNLRNPGLDAFLKLWNDNPMSSWSTASKRIEFSQMLSKSHWGLSLSGLWTEQHQGQSMMSGGVLRNDGNGPSWAILAWGRAGLCLTERPRSLNQREALLVSENEWHGLPHSYTAYDFTTSRTIPFLQKTVLNSPKWNQKVH